ncbi:MAG: prenyltransferase [Candidatus Velthaea sp.]
MRTVAAFIRLSRLKFLIGGIAGFAVGIAAAAFEGRAVTPAAYALGQALVTAFQLMVHYANDYFDRAADARSVRTPYSGGSGALVDGSLAPGVALAAAAACAGAGLAATVGFAAGRNVPAAVLGASIGLLAWFYSAPPLRLLASGFGEAVTALVVGVLVPLLGAAAAGALDRLALLACAPLAFAMFAMMLAVEWPDVAADAATGKRNLIVRFGRRFAGGAAQVAAGLAPAAVLLAGLAAAVPANALYAAVLAVPALRFAAAFGPATPAATVARRGVAFYVFTALCTLAAFVRPLR